MHSYPPPYVVEGSPYLETGLVVTYPKFKTKYGTNVSFKLGIWNSDNKTYDSNRFKVINVPVLESHGGLRNHSLVSREMGARPTIQWDRVEWGQRWLRPDSQP